MKIISCVSSLFMLLVPGCHEENTDTGQSLPPFCYSLEDGETWRFEGSGGGETSGSFDGNLITDFSEDIFDPDYVAYVEYVVENLDVGGTTQQYGRTDNVGIFQGTGAPGLWAFTAGTQVGDATCSAYTEFQVEVGTTTRVCAVMHCQ